MSDVALDGRAGWRAARRAAARAHHPDRGGSVEALLAAYAEVDARFGAGGAPDAVGHAVEVLPPPWWRRLGHHLAHRADLLRRPGRRWIDITAATAPDAAHRPGGPR